MPGFSKQRFHSTIQIPAAEALETLARDSMAIFAKWHQEVRGLGLDDDKFLSEWPLDFAQLSAYLRASSFRVFRKRIEEFGGMLVQRGVRLDRAAAALNRLFEIGVLHLSQRGSHQAGPILALARLHSLVGMLVISGYTGAWASAKGPLAEVSLSEAEDRRHGASAYVTKIYEDERQRLSRDLHDEVGHDLILIKLYLEMIALDTNKKQPQSIKPRLTEAIGLVSHAIDSVRRLVLDLGPAVFEELGFLPAFRTYTSQFSARTSIAVTFQEGYVPDDIPMSHQVAMYRLLQGALSNVLKHASAKSVKVTLGTKKDSALIMVIEDDGVGFDLTARLGRRSFGLTAMRERVEVLGGRIHIQSRSKGVAAKAGTRIEVDLPIPGGVT